MSIKQKAKQIADKLISFIRNHPICSSINWNMKFPDCTYLGEANGGSAIAYAFGLSRSRKIFDLTSYIITNSLVSAWGIAVDGAVITNDISHKHMTTKLLCLSNYTGNILVRSKIKNITNSQNWDTFYLLLHSVLNDADPNTYYNLAKLKDQINAAPCGGTYSYANYNNPVSNINFHGSQGWASENKFTHSEQEQNNGQFYHPGTYHGLDFMLLYNLASLCFPNEFPYYVNLRTRTITQIFPYVLPFYPNYVVGIDGNPLTLKAIHSIQSNSIIQANGNVTYIAGEQIDLLPGFDSQYGAEFDARIESYNCNGLPFKNSKLLPWSNDDLITSFDSIIGIPNHLRPKQIYSSDNNIDNDADISLFELNNFYFLPNSDSIYINLYPNPANDYINVEIETKQDASVNIFIVDYKGVTIISGLNYLISSKQKYVFDIKNLNTGQYFILIQGPNINSKHSFVKN